MEIVNSPPHQHLIKKEVTMTKKQFHEYMESQKENILSVDNRLSFYLYHGYFALNDEELVKDWASRFARRFSVNHEMEVED